MINKIYNQDCLITMNNMPDNYIDLTVTSPPYDNIRTCYEYKFDFENIAKELFRVTKDGGVVVWVVGDATIKGSETGTSFKQALYFKDIGFNLHDTMIYRKTNPTPYHHNRYNPFFEFMFVFSKYKPKTFNSIKRKKKSKSNTQKRTFRYPDGTLRLSNSQNTENITILDNVWDIPTNAGIKGHPAQFPEQLANDHILSWSNPNDIIYDCFGGAGTTGIMANINNRNFILSEVSSEYCELMQNRFKQRLNLDIEIIKE